MKTKSVLLLSGGLDSGALLFWAKNQGIEVFPLFVNYGQVSFSGEWLSIQSLLLKAELSPILPLNVSEVFKLGFRNLEVKNNHIPIDQYFPSRNLFLLTLAAIYAYRIDVHSILIGLIGDTTNLLPDCSIEFMEKAQSVLRIEYSDITVDAPFITRSKIDIVREAMQYGFEPEVTYCCNRQSDHHCWQCPSCIDRYKVLEAVK